MRENEKGAFRRRDAPSGYHVLPIGNYPPRDGLILVAPQLCLQCTRKMSLLRVAPVVEQVRADEFGWIALPRHAEQNS